LLPSSLSKLTNQQVLTLYFLAFKNYALHNNYRANHRQYAFG
jgi:hypothetical protein